MKTINPTYAQQMQAIREEEQRAERVAAVSAVLFVVSAAIGYLWMLQDTFGASVFHQGLFTVFLMIAPLVLIAIAIWIAIVYLA